MTRLLKTGGRWPALAVAVAALAGVGLLACGAAPNRIDVSTYPPDMQARYDLLEKRCTRCHELERPLNASVGEGGWAKYVRRMARHPAAGISATEQREIALFLEFHATKRREANARAQDPDAQPAGGAP